MTEEGYVEVGETPEGMPIISPIIIQAAYRNYQVALEVKRAATMRFMQTNDHQAFDDMEIAEIDVEIARAEVERVGKLLDLVGLESVLRSVQMMED
jgi:hypothetical protein